MNRNSSFPELLGSLGLVVPNTEFNRRAATYAYESRREDMKRLSRLCRIERKLREIECAEMSEARMSLAQMISGHPRLKSDIAIWTRP